MAEKGKNRLTPSDEATGDHCSFRTDENDFIVCIATWIKNIFNPNGFQLKKRVDVTGVAHNGIATPHVHEGKNVRPALKSELPKIMRNSIVLLLILSVLYFARF